MDTLQTPPTRTTTPRRPARTLLAVFAVVAMVAAVSPTALAQEEGGRPKPEQGQVCSSEGRERVDSRLRGGVDSGGLAPSDREQMLERWAENCDKLDEVRQRPSEIDRDLEQRVEESLERGRREVPRYWENRQSPAEASGVSIARIRALVMRMVESLLGARVEAEDVLERLTKPQAGVGDGRDADRSGSVQPVRAR